MTGNLLPQTWTDLDSYELRLMLDKCIGGPGQYDGRPANTEKFFLPLAGESCRIVLTFRGNKIITIERGVAFDTTEWKRVSEEIEKSILAGPLKFGREYSFSSFRVPGSWRGDRSGLQILPPPDDAPRALAESAEHPFILEFPIRESDFFKLTNHRLMREHRKLTLLLNVLLAGHTSHPPRRATEFWARVPRDGDLFNVEWVQQYFFAKIGTPVIDALSPAAGEQLEEVEPAKYYTDVGNDGKGLRVPTNLDQSICLYLQLSPTHRAKFDRATFWMEMASRQRTISMSLSFASLVSAVESLIDRGTTHRVYCTAYKETRQHEAPGVTERFRVFVEQYAPGASLKSRRTKMYSLRSSILHGSELMQHDQDLAFGWDPPSSNQRDLHDELSSLTRTALRNWLKNQPKT